CGSSAQGQANLDLVVAKLKTSATTVSLGELNENSLQVHAYPNPTNGQLSFDISSLNTGNCEIEIFDLQGRSVLNAKLAANPTIVVDLTHLPRGLYMARVSGGNEAVTVKVQKL